MKKPDLFFMLLLPVLFLGISNNVFSQNKYIEVSVYQADLSDCYTSVEERTESKQLEIYPNPNQGSFLLKMKDLKCDSKILVSVHDINGKNLYEESFYPSGNTLTEQISIEGLPKGMYVVTVTQNSSVYNGKLIIH